MPKPVGLLALLLALLAALPASAWPERAIRLLVAYPPGGVSDETARLLAQGLSQRLKVPVLVENRAGAGGVAAMEALARAAPDGHTLCYSAISPLVIAPLLGKLAYDAQRDFAPVMRVMDTPVLLLAHAGFKPDSLAELLALARSHPGRVRWASSGQATIGHLVLEQLKMTARVDITHVPYKGGGQQLNDALSGQFEMLSSNVAPQQLQYVRQGRLKSIAVGAPQRLAALPEVPTLAELGYPTANLVSTFGIFAPQGVPPQRLQRLNELLNEVLAEPELQQRLAASSNLPGGGSARDFERLIERERSRAVSMGLGGMGR
ncbi:tripartite tricarboxylate transporter substrate binding protein [Paucibacter sp. PLA-PC-4]|uniref:Bug family tripartite tricarboxylate transporter substrate binding protein n=1 Tax=Paucibacter sp. PLA-PC-4 TaxID=2993655 RepID=UPI002248CC39|nr:tripartite tricarboxylate transporter substrate binding protein [Paucibacter sp. PLA-PC-4]MCX2860524.1 tripartite tricarboxylate transporter substrate binding protein [Paucibacter sp. PLA-PC-4]